MLKLHDKGNYLAFDSEECRSFGSSLADRYQTALPFPHIVIDDFLDAEVLREIAQNYPATDGKRHFDRNQERLKFQFHVDEAPAGVTRNLLAELNGRAFLGFLEGMTGIRGLISDPYLLGGGLHLTKRGGHLSVHADFNVHSQMQVERRLNLLIYLNEDWDDAYGGFLELWDREMQTCRKKVAPLLGRAVIFNTALDSYHGHPDPLNCPPERDRRSIATYYYTAFEQADEAIPRRTTQFQVRPKSADRSDWHVKVNHFIKDWVPAKLQRHAKRLNRFK